MQPHRAHVLMLAVILAICLGSLQNLVAGYSPTRTEINLAWVPIDLYSSSSTNGSLGSPLPSCPSSYTIRNCYKLMFNNNSSTTPYTSGNYIAQGVTGARFMFGLATVSTQGFYSTPWNSSGTISSTWVSNLALFLSDLNSYGVQRISISPMLEGGTAGATPITPATNVYGCSTTVPLVFYPWIPYGYLSSNLYPDCQDVNSAYSSAANPNTINPPNKYFWGWTPFFNLVNSMFGAVHSSGLALEEFDYDQEISLVNFTVQARLIYDPQHSASGGSGTTDVLSSIRYYATANSLSSSGITLSSVSYRTDSAGYDCGSYYGDSARILGASELAGTLAGGGGAFGEPYNLWMSTMYDLPCGGTNPSGWMAQLPLSYTQPGMVDLHIYPCLLLSSGGCNTGVSATTEATITYSDVWSFLSYRGFTGDVAMVGETTSNQNCQGYTTAMASQNVSGYTASSLYSNHASETVLRVWGNATDTGHCYVAPSTINPPYTP